MLYKNTKFNTIMSGLRRADREMEALQLLGPTIWSQEIYDFQAKLLGPHLKMRLCENLFVIY